MPPHSSGLLVKIKSKKALKSLGKRHGHHVVLVRSNGLSLTLNNTFDGISVSSNRSVISDLYKEGTYKEDAFEMNAVSRALSMPVLSESDRSTA